MAATKRPDSRALRKNKSMAAPLLRRAPKK
jgi:hypothetical protein